MIVCGISSIGLRLLDLTCSIAYCMSGVLNSLSNCMR